MDSNKAILDACNQGIEEDKIIEIRQVKHGAESYEE